MAEKRAAAGSAAADRAGAQKAPARGDQKAGSQKAHGGEPVPARSSCCRRMIFRYLSLKNGLKTGEGRQTHASGVDIGETRPRRLSVVGRFYERQPEKAKSVMAKTGTEMVYVTPDYQTQLWNLGQVRAGQAAEPRRSRNHRFSREKAAIDKPNGMPD